MEKVVIQSKIERSVWDYLFYFFLSILTVWLVLKVIGVIQTPVWLEYGVSIGSSIGVVATLFQGINKKFDKVDGKFERVLSEMRNLHANSARMESKLAHIDRDLESVKDTLFSQ